MNTNLLKRFAKEARIKLISQIAQKLDFVQATSGAFSDTNKIQLKNLDDKIQLIGKEQVIETVAYTWFNRLMALRFMDANGYNMPKVVTPLAGMSNPEILQNALAATIDTDLNLDRQRLNDLLDGKTAATDAHTKAYKMLLVAACNQAHKVLPFMFERISDYTELLLPDDLLSDFSIVADVRNGMSDEDCQQEEVIGWLYQFYISDKKDDVFNGLKKNIKITAENIPAATQLFTPRWIVRYMVENTLGKLWLSFRPLSKLRDFMPYFIEAPEGNAPAPLPEGIKGVEDITFIDPCQGSGHVLVYAFDLFTKIYEEEGYNTNEIPALILKNNLFGIDIDPRAAQLAAFALTMKARNYYSRFLRKPVQPNVIALQNVAEDTIEQVVKLPIKVNGKKIEKHQDLSLFLLTQADNFGSLIQIEPEEVEAIQIQEGNIWQEKQELLRGYAELLSRQFHCVVTNPPYMGSSGMDDILKKYLDEYYPSSKVDLMTCFMERALVLNSSNGYWAMINLPSWMFLSTFEKFRKTLILDNKIDTMLHLGRGIFGSDFGSIAFSLQNRTPKLNEKGIYRRLFIEHVQVRSVETINKLFFDKDMGFYQANQDKFYKIPGSPIAYWVKDKAVKSFVDFELLKSIAAAKAGLATGDNTIFEHYWFEVFLKNIAFDCLSNNESSTRPEKWYPCNSGGAYKKWYGNNEIIVNWQFDGNEIKNFRDSKGKLRSRPQNLQFFFKSGITWTKLSSKNFGARLREKGFIFDDTGRSAFSKREGSNINILALLCSNLANFYLKILNPTMSFTSGDVENIPVNVDLLNNDLIKNRATECISITREDWDSRENSWNFQQNALLTQNTPSVKAAFETYKTYWTAQFYALHQNEEALNRQFIDIYGLQDELTPSVPLSEITILQEESKIVDNELFIEPVSVLLQFISYAVGCLFGRYSLDKPSLILANQGETLKDYLAQVPNPRFMPDEDNIIPVLEDEWFNDDIVGRFRTFLKASFGEAQFEENLKYIEETIGKDIRKYFIKDFYNDHIKRYKKRPIYWLFSSPKGHFKALIYLHRYQPDVCSKLLNDYVQAFISKLEAGKHTQTMLSLRADITAREKALAEKAIEQFEGMLKDCRLYEKTLFNVATQKIALDLDDGVKVNYQKFKDVLVLIKGLEKEEA